MKVYVIIGGMGAYDDYTEWVEVVCASHDFEYQVKEVY